MTFLPTETRQTVEVVLLNDDILEGDENFMGSLSLQAESAGLTLGVDSATATIQDDDGETLDLKRRPDF